MKKSSIILFSVVLLLVVGFSVFFLSRDEKQPQEATIVGGKTEVITQEPGLEAPSGDYTLVEGGVATSENFMLEATPQSGKK